MAKSLIINADDCNLTDGVTRAILNCHDQGIVSSTTFMINLPVKRKTVESLLKRKQLGVGLHLNVTLGSPVTAGKKIPSLLNGRGLFERLTRTRLRTCRAKEVFIEYENQIRLFRKVFSCRPTHLDTHHQLHDHPMFLKILQSLALKYRLPIRRSRLMNKRTEGTPDACFGNMNPKRYWRKRALEYRIRNLPEGVSEIVCHPGWVDSRLKNISSFTTGRGMERRLFASKELKRWVLARGIAISHYGLCYTESR